MLIDFTDNNNTIDDVIIDDIETDEFSSFILKTKTINYKFRAIGDCCSHSVFIEYKDYKFNNLIGKIIKNIKTIDIPEDYDLEINHEDDTYISPHLYEMHFQNTEETFKFMLINYSNGYYDGWMNITEIDNNSSLIILIGLPACGKTTYYKEILDNSYKFYDDFITDIYDGNLLKDIKNNVKICISDPRLCNYNTFQQIMKEIEKYITKDKIILILFRNNKLSSLINAKKRDKKNVNNMIEMYSSLYNIENYLHYNHKLI
jgi:predicted kinase